MTDSYRWDLSDVQASILVGNAPADDREGGEFRQLGRTSRRVAASHLAVTIDKNAAGFVRLDEPELAHARVVLTDIPIRRPAEAMWRPLCMDRVRGR